MHFYFKTYPVPHILLTAQQTHKQVTDSADKSVPFMTLRSEMGSHSMIQALDRVKWWTQAALTQGKSIR